MKKKLVLLFMILLIVLSNIPVYASSDSGEVNFAENKIKFLSKDELICLVYDTILDFEPYVDNQFNYYLGSAVTIYDQQVLENKSIIEKREKQKVYPVFRDNVIIYTLIDSGYSVKASLEGVDELNQIVKQTEKFAIIIVNESIINVYEDKNDISKEFSSTIQTTYIDKVKLNMDNITSARASVYLNLPNKTWMYDGTCWAACMASFIQYYLGTNITAERVCQTTIGDEPPAGYPYKQLTTVRQYFSNHYGIATGYSSSVSASHMSTIRSMLNNGNAYIFGWKYTDPSSGDNTGHATICDGYETTSSGGYKYKIMDPDGGRDYSITVTSGTSIPVNNKFITQRNYVLDRTLSYDYLTK